jgi:hypothetical protein
MTDMNVSLEQEGSRRHEAVLDAVATHSRGPDAEASGVQQREARERDVQRRDADKLSARDGAFQREADNKQNIRSAAWKAMAEAKQNAARADAGGAHTGAPRDWHISAKGEWDRLPDQTKLAVKRSQAAQNEISQALDSVRPVLKQQGMSDVQGVKQLIAWENNIRNPATRDAAFQALHQAYGYQPQTSAQAVADAEVRGFSAGRPHMQNLNVVKRMVQLLEGGLANSLQRAYDLTLAGY